MNKDTVNGITNSIAVGLFHTIMEMIYTIFALLYIIIKVNDLLFSSSFYSDDCNKAVAKQTHRHL